MADRAHILSTSSPGVEPGAESNLPSQPREGALRVALIYRKQREGLYSIEALFSSIASQLHRQVEVIEYEIGNRQSVLRDAWRLRQLHADIYHVTGDVHYLVNLLPSRNTILTIHDLGHYRYGLRGIRRWLYKWLWLIFPIRRAGAVTAVSTATRDAIVKHFGVPGRRIDVIENCYGNMFTSVARPFSAECPVILQVGTRPYKNVPRLVEALKGLRCTLVLLGRLDEEIQKKLASCGTSYVNHVDLTEDEVRREYVNCDIVSFVSLGEGFGLPIIEGQATGRPVITADLSPMRDVAGDGACLVDPLDVDQIREGFNKIISDAAYRRQLVERGQRNVIRYSPATISGRYLDLYRRMARS